MTTERDLSEYYEREAAVGARLGFGSRGRRDELRTAFVDLLVDEDRLTLVDVGAGPAGDGAAFAARGVRYVGLDLAVGNARAAAGAGLSVVPGSLYEPPFRARSFLAGWTMSTLLHVPDARFDEAVNATTNLLQPGSPLAIGLWGGNDREFVNGDDHFDPPRFFSHRSDERVQAMLSGHGDIESFESWPTNGPEWSYQFIVLRV